MIGRPWAGRFLGIVKKQSGFSCLQRNEIVLVADMTDTVPASFPHYAGQAHSCKAQTGHVNRIYRYNDGVNG